MKRIFPLVFLIIVLFNVIGYFIVFKVEQFQIKAEIELEIKQGVATDAMVMITIKKSDQRSIEWTESDKEFRYKDDLYDVVKYSETETTITYYCINDSQEESLFSNLTEHINVHVAAQNTSKNSKKLHDHVIKLYFLTAQQSVLPMSEMTTVVFSNELITSSIYLQKQTPPPELV